MKTVLTIAGSDSVGGAGIQADIKTITMHGVYAMSAITAVTAQNTMGIRSIHEVPAGILKDQIDAVFEDIFPDAVKIGMVFSSGQSEIIAEMLVRHKAKNIIVDPVMVATSGAALMQKDALKSLCRYLLPIATLITPNIPEANVLASMDISDDDSMVKAAKKIGSMYGCAVLLKGGHRSNDSNDLLYKDQDLIWFNGKKTNNPNSHGTGCTLSSAVAANMAKGFCMETSVEKAKKYITQALDAQLDIGHGSGPIKHNFILDRYF